jgi:hypothetical protein
MPGRNAWCQRNIAERLTFSSFTTLRDDLWAADKPRDFAIVALEGYALPQGLDQSSVDSMWLKNAPSEPLIVWDGYCPHALFEVIYECFGFIPGQTDGKIGVFKISDGQIGEEVKDDRSEKVLALRPRKANGLTPIGRENHIADLYAWSCLFDAGAGPGKASPFIKNGGRATKSLYSDFFTYTPRDLTIRPMGSPQSKDSEKREPLWSSTAQLKAPRVLQILQRGQGGPKGSNRNEVRLYVGDDLRKELEARARKAVSVVEEGRVDGSLYETLVPRTRDPKTGLIHGAKEASQEAFKATLGRPDEAAPAGVVEAMNKDCVDETASAAVQSKSWLGRIMSSARKKSQGF